MGHGCANQGGQAQGLRSSGWASVLISHIFLYMVYSTALLDFLVSFLPHVSALVFPSSWNTPLHACLVRSDDLFLGSSVTLASSLLWSLDFGLPIHTVNSA